MNESINEQVKRLNRQIARANLPDEVRNEVYQDISEAVTAVQKRSHEGAFEQHCASHVGREYSKLERGNRERPVCYCSDPACRIKRGLLPVQLISEHYQHFGTRGGRDRVTRYLQDHPQAIVIIEALRSWDWEAAKIERSLREAIADVQEHRTSAYDAARNYEEGEA